jgi:hypothetical protein
LQNEKCKKQNENWDDDLADYGQYKAGKWERGERGMKKIVIKIN